MPEAAILHADLDAFFASVEQRDDPSLRGRPIAVGGWVVTAASYEAKAHGVASGMGGAEARRRCPDLRFVRPRWEAYVQASRDVFDVFRRTSPVVEGVSIDEAFIDDLPGNLKPARAMGMATVHHTTAEESVPQLEELLGVRVAG